VGEVKYPDMDPEAVASLRRALGRVDGLQARLVAAARPGPVGSSLAAVDDALPQARFVSIHAIQGVSAALDHLLAWRLLMHGPLVPLHAPMTLLRGTLEGAVRCRWLVDGDLDTVTRVARGYSAKRDDYLQRRRFEESRERLDDEKGRPARMASTGKSASERLVELEGWRLDAKIPVVAFTDTTALMKAYRLERWFRLASAAAHGKEWVLAAADNERRLDTSAPGVAHGIFSARDDVLLALTVVAVDAVERAVVDFEAYISMPRSGQ